MLELRNKKEMEYESVLTEPVVMFAERSVQEVELLASLGSDLGTLFNNQ